MEEQLTKEQAFEEISRKPLLRIGIVCILFMFGIFSFPFVWIWHSFELAAKICASSFIGYLLTVGLYLFIKKIINEAVDKEFSKPIEPSAKSKFLQRLEEKMAEINN